MVGRKTNKSNYEKLQIFRYSPSSPQCLYRFGAALVLLCVCYWPKSVCEPQHVLDLDCVLHLPHSFCLLLSCQCRIQSNSPRKKKGLLPSDALPARISLFFLFWHTLCFSLRCCKRVCAVRIFSNLSLTLSFLLRHYLTSACPFYSASTASPLLLSLTLSHASL